MGREQGMDIGATHSLPVQVGSKNAAWFQVREGIGEWYAEAKGFGSNALPTAADTTRSRETEHPARSKKEGLQITGPPLGNVGMDAKHLALPHTCLAFNSMLLILPLRHS